MNQNKINSIKKLKKKGMYEITINDDVYKVTEDLIVKYYLIKDKILTDDELDLLKSKIEDENILLKVYNYISYQFRSEKEIEDYLYALNANNLQVSDIINKLKMISLIDDDSLSKSILNYTIAQLKGPKSYKKKLYERKISIVYDYTEEDQLETINKAIEKNKDKNIKQPITKQKNLLINKLLRDGFDEKYIFSEVNKINFSDESNETLKKEIERLKIKYSKYTDKEIRNKIINNLLSKGYKYTNIKNQLDEN